MLVSITAERKNANTTGLPEERARLAPFQNSYYSQDYSFRFDSDCYMYFSHELAGGGGSQSFPVAVMVENGQAGNSQATLITDNQFSFFRVSSYFSDKTLLRFLCLQVTLFI